MSSSSGPLLSPETIVHPYEYENWMLYNDEYAFPPPMLNNHEGSLTMNLVNHAAILGRPRSGIISGHEIFPGNPELSGSFSMFPGSNAGVPLYTTTVNDGFNQMLGHTDQQMTLTGMMTDMTSYSGPSTTATMTGNNNGTTGTMGDSNKESAKKRARRSKNVSNGGVNLMVSTHDSKVPEKELINGLTQTTFDTDQTTMVKRVSTRRKSETEMKKETTEVIIEPLETDDFSELEDGESLDGPQERQRKEAHLVSEQKRRKTLNMAFAELRNCLPEGKDNPGLSRAAVLRGGK